MIAPAAILLAIQASNAQSMRTPLKREVTRYVHASVSEADAFEQGFNCPIGGRNPYTHDDPRHHEWNRGFKESLKL